VGKNQRALALPTALDGDDTGAEVEAWRVATETVEEREGLRFKSEALRCGSAELRQASAELRQESDALRQESDALRQTSAFLLLHSGRQADGLENARSNGKLAMVSGLYSCRRADGLEDPGG
jgi:hypothetical protein